MLYRTTIEKLSGGRSLTSGSWDILLLALLRRRAIAPFGDVSRLGIFERNLVDDVLASIGVSDSKEVVTTGLRITPSPIRETVQTVGTSPRDMYENLVLPLSASMRGRTVMGARVCKVPSLRGELAQELTFVMLSHLQECCALLAVGNDSNGDWQSTLGDAVRAALAARELFGGFISPELLDDWGVGIDNHQRGMRIEADAALISEIRIAMHDALYGLRYLLECSAYDCEGIVLDIWEAEKELWGKHAMAIHCPIWWMRPIRPLSDPHGKPPDIRRLFEPWSDYVRPTSSTKPIEVFLSRSAIIGLTAILGSLLVRCEQAISSGGRPLQSTVRSGLYPVSEIAGLHARLTSLI